MREYNQLAVQPKAFVSTTDSNHALEVYLIKRGACISMVSINSV